MKSLRALACAFAVTRSLASALPANGADDKELAQRDEDGIVAKTNAADSGTIFQEAAVGGLPEATASQLGGDDLVARARGRRGKKTRRGRTRGKRVRNGKRRRNGKNNRGANRAAANSCNGTRRVRSARAKRGRGKNNNRGKKNRTNNTKRNDRNDAANGKNVGDVNAGSRIAARDTYEALRSLDLLRRDAPQEAYDIVARFLEEREPTHIRVQRNAAAEDIDRAVVFEAEDATAANTEEAQSGARDIANTLQEREEDVDVAAQGVFQAEELQEVSAAEDQTGEGEPKQEAASIEEREEDDSALLAREYGTAYQD